VFKKLEKSLKKTIKTEIGDVYLPLLKKNDELFSIFFR